MYNESAKEENFYSWFDTAWSPPNELLKEFHIKSWINLVNEYEESWVWFEWTLTCNDWDCDDDEREYISYCEVCEEKEDLINKK
jgi:hypothetical protein